MSLAVVIVNYNAGDWLQRSVKSALASPEVSRVFVVDNASQDGSIAALKNALSKVDDLMMNKLEIVLNQENVGFAKANNQILRQILPLKQTKESGEHANRCMEFDYVLLLNPDCELAIDVLPVMLSYFASHNKLGMAGCVIHNSDGSIQSTCRRQFPTPWTAFLRMSQLYRFGFAQDANFDLGDQTLPKQLEMVDAISGAFMLVRVEAIKEVGVFDEAYFMHCEDLDWCKRFQLAKWDIGFIPQVSVIHEKGVSSQARPVGVLWNLHNGMLRFFGKFYKKQSPLYLRILVYIGVYVSFFGRACTSVVKRLICTTTDS